MNRPQTSRRLKEKIRDWALSSIDGPDFNATYAQVEYLAGELFYQYIPTIKPQPAFLARLESWVSCATSESDQKLLLELVTKTTFIGRDEFNSLYRAAYNGPITRFLLDACGFTMDSADLSETLEEALERTWFCPITDSMDIANFYHANNIEGTHHRPSWITLKRFGSKKKVASYISRNSIERLVLLEDFVGSGSQMSPAIEFALSLSNDCQIILIPLVVCPVGLKRGRDLERVHDRISFEPVLELKPDEFIPGASAPAPCGDRHSAFFSQIRSLVTRLHPRVTGHASPDPKTKPYGPLGFCKTGGLVIMHTNCPDNTLPVIHHRSSTWSPIFPRSSRV